MGKRQQKKPTLGTIDRALSLIKHFQDTASADDNRGHLRDIVCHVFVNGIMTREELAKHGIDRRAIKAVYETGRVTMTDGERTTFFNAVRTASNNLREQLTPKAS